MIDRERLLAVIDDALIDGIKERFRFFGGAASVMKMPQAVEEFRDGMILLKDCHAQAITIVTEIFGNG